MINTKDMSVADFDCLRRTLGTVGKRAMVFYMMDPAMGFSLPSGRLFITCSTADATYRATYRMEIADQERIDSKAILARETAR